MKVSLPVTLPVPLIRFACALGLLLASQQAARGQIAPQSPAAAIEGVPPRPPTLRQTAIPDAFVGVHFEFSVQAVDGAGEVVMTLRGTPPSGLDIQSGAKTLALSGIPQEIGIFDLNVTATDSYGLMANQTFSMRVLPHPLSGPAEAVIADKEAFTVADADNVFFPAHIADTEAVHVADTDGVFMPAVIKVTEAVVVTDTDHVFMPAVIKVSEAVMVTDTDKVVSSAIIADIEAITVTDTDSTAAKIGVTPSTVPAGTYNVGYNVQFSAAGADGTASLVPSGTLPSGMSFVSSGGNILLRGTPTATGSFPFTITASNSGNSTVDVVKYTLVINPASQTIQFGAAPSPVYGGAAFTVTATASSGLPVTISTSSGLVTGTGPFTPIAAGLAVFQAMQAGNADYIAAPVVNQDVIVAQAPLSVTATSVARAFDQPNPTFAYTLSGFVNNDNASVVTGVPVLSTTAVPVSQAGIPYAINVATGTLSAANYSFTAVSGTLTITAASQTITFYALPSIVHGSAAFPLTARASSGLAVTYTVTGPASISNSMLTVTGTGQVTVTANQSGSANYSAATAVSRSFTAQ